MTSGQSNSIEPAKIVIAIKIFLMRFSSVGLKSYLALSCRRVAVFVHLVVAAADTL
jgi:hypothetical protein